MKKLLLVLMLLMIPPAVAFDIQVDGLVIEKEPTDVSFTSDSKFSGVLYLTYNNLDSSTVLLVFSENSFTGSGPYQYDSSWSIEGTEPGAYTITANLTNSSGHTVATDIVNGEVNSSDPQITSMGPSGFVTSTTTSLALVTNEDSTCKYSGSNTTYGNMTSEFATTGGTSHWHPLSGLNEGEYTYFVNCIDLKGNTINRSVPLEFKVDLPPSAEITLSHESPVSAGTFEVTVVTSENLDSAPELEYAFNDNPNGKKIISLSGEDSLWKGYMIITKKDDNKVGTFHFKGVDGLGTVGRDIEEGKVFLVDTTKPPAPINIETSITSNGDVRLKWYYEGEEIDSYQVYRATASGLDFIDIYSHVGNGTQFIDYSTTEQVTYYYRVAAVDKAGNVGPMSSEVYATGVKKEKKTKVESNTSTIVADPTVVKAPEPRVLPPHLVVKVKDMQKKVDQVKLDINTAKSQLEQNSEVALISELGLITKVDTAGATLDAMAEQLEALIGIYKEESALDAELNSIDKEMTRIRAETPKEVSILERASFVQTINDIDIREGADYLFPDMADKEKKKYLKNVASLQDNVNIDVDVNIVRVSSVDQTSVDRTFVKKRLSYLGSEPLEDVIIVEIIPKGFAESATEIRFTSGAPEVIKDDPVVKWGFLNFGSEEKSIEYHTDRRVDMTDAKGVTSIVLIGPAQFEKPSEVVGFSISSILGDSAVTSFEGLSVILGLLIIVGLVAYYLSLTRGKSIKTKVSKFVRGPVKKLATPASYPHLAHVGRSAFKHLKVPKKPDTVRVQTTTLNVMNQLILQAAEHVSTYDFDKAQSVYSQIQTHYRILPKDQQQQIFPYCMQLQKSIDEGNKEFYKSVL